MSADAHLINRTVLAVDGKKFSKYNTRRQSEFQAELKQLAGNAARLAGLGLDPDPDAWDVQWTGDGLLHVLPADADDVRLVGRFPRELNTLLAIRNGDRVPEARMRLRLAIHHDALLPSTAWYAGPALIEVSRLLDSGPVRAALDAAEPAHLALIVSEPVYRTVVRSGLDGLSEDDFAEVAADIPDKDYRSVAYVHVPGKPGRAVRKNVENAEAARRESTGSSGRTGGSGASDNRVRLKGDRNNVQISGGDITNGPARRKAQ